MRCNKCLAVIPSGEEVRVAGEVYEGSGTGDTFQCLKCYKETQERNRTGILIMVGLFVICMTLLIIAVAIGKIK